MSGMVAVILINPAVVAKGASLLVTAFPCVSTLVPAVSAGAASSCASGAAISAAAALASALPVVAVGGTVAITAAFLSKSFCDSLETKRRADFSGELDRIESEMKVRAAGLGKFKADMAPEFGRALSEAAELGARLQKLKNTFSETGELFRAGELVLEARSLAEELKECEADLTYLSYKIGDELNERAGRLIRSAAAVGEEIEKLSARVPASKELAAAAKKIIVPDFSNILWRIQGPERLGEMRSALNECEAALENLRAMAIEAASAGRIDDIISRAINEAVAAGKASTPIPAEKTKKAPEADAADKINRLLSALSFLKETVEYTKILKKFDAIKKEADPERRAVLYDDFVIFCEGLIKTERRRRRDIEDLCEMKRQLLCFESPNVMAAAAMIDDILNSGGPADMSAVKDRIAEAFERDAVQLNSMAYAGALRNAFEELGYETDENFETVLIKDKKAYIHKPAMSDYHIQLISNPEKNIFQAEVVREVETAAQAAESSRSHEQRDTEVQSEFCADYERVLKSLESKGVGISEKARKKPGEIKVKKVAGVSGPKNKRRKTDGGETASVKRRS
jgi:hypothetical protein